MADITEFSDVRLQLASVSGDGMNVEVCAETSDARFSDGSANPLFWFRADEDGKIMFVAGSKHGRVSIALEDLEEAISLAKQEVHCETFYDDT